MAIMAIIFKSGAVLETELGTSWAKELRDKYMANPNSSQPLVPSRSMPNPYIFLPKEIVGMFIRKNSD